MLAYNLGSVVNPITAGYKAANFLSFFQGTPSKVNNFQKRSKLLSKVIPWEVLGPEMIVTLVTVNYHLRTTSELFLHKTSPLPPAVIALTMKK